VVKVQPTEAQIAARIRGYIGPADPVTGCRVWTGYIGNMGYGILTLFKQPRLASRLAYELEVGPIPPGMFVCHHCDNRACCEVSHLFLGTQGDNMRDRDAKQRQPRGETHGMRKLSEEQVRWVRSEFRTGRSKLSIARELGVAHVTIRRILNGRNWKHVTDATAAG